MAGRKPSGRKRCSFCGSFEDEAGGVLLSGPAGGEICSECAHIIYSIFKDAGAYAGAGEAPAPAKAAKETPPQKETKQSSPWADALQKAMEAIGEEP